MRDIIIYVLLGISCLILGFTIGYIIGFGDAVDLGFKFFQLDNEAFAQAIQTHQAKIRMFFNMI